MTSLWSTAKALRIPLDPKLKYIIDIPYTMSFAIRKRQQIDSLNELPKEKRPTDEIIWDGSSSELEAWMEKVMGSKETAKDRNVIIDINDVEG